MQEITERQLQTICSLSFFCFTTPNAKVTISVLINISLILFSRSQLAFLLPTFSLSPFLSNRKKQARINVHLPTHPPFLTCNVIKLGVCSPHFSPLAPPKFLLPLLNCIDQKIFPSLYFATSPSPPFKPPFLQIYKIYIYRDRFYFVVEEKKGKAALSN